MMNTCADHNFFCSVLTALSLQLPIHLVIVNQNSQEFYQQFNQDFSELNDNALRNSTERQLVHQILRGELDAISLEKNYQDHHGNSFAIRQTISLQRDPEGHPQSWMVFLEDLREKQKAEAKLRQSEANLKTAEQLAHLGHWEWNLGTEIVTWSDEVYRICGVEKTDQDLSFIQLSQIIHHEDLEKWQRETQKAIEEQKSCQFDLRILRPYGEIRYLLLQAYPAITEGTVTKLFGICMDITDKKLIEMAWKKSLEDLEKTVEERTILLRETIAQLEKQIIERETIRQELQKSQAQYQKLAEFVPVGIFQTDEKGNCIYFNERWSEITGLTPEESLGDGWVKAIHPEDQEYLLTIWQNAVQENRPSQAEYRIISPREKVTWVLGQSVIERDQLGTIIGYVGTITDITERKQTEETLLRISKAIEATGDAIAIADAQGNHIYHNRAFAELLEYNTPEEFNAAGGIPIAFTNLGIMQELFNTIMQGSSWKGELEMQSKSGLIIDVFLRADAMIDSGGKMIGLIGIMRDITQEKLAQINQQQQAQIIEQIRDAIIVTNVEGLITKWNKGAERLYGYTSSEMLGHPFTSLYPPASCNLLKKQIFPHLFHGGNYEGEIIAKRRSGEPFYSFLSLSLQQGDLGQIIGIIAYAIDVTERKKEENALRESEARFRSLAARLELINQSTQKIRQSLEIDDIVETICEQIYQLLRVDRCSFVWYHPDQQVWEIVTEARHPELPSHLGVYPVEIIGFSPQDLIEAKMIKIADQKAVTNPAIRQFLQQVNHQAFLVIPIITASEKKGTLSMSMTQQTREWTEDEVELFHAMGNQLAIALNQAELYQAARQSTREAEAKTRQLEIILEELQETQTQLIQSEKMSSLGQLVAGVAHEINNPINFIFGNLVHAENYLNNLLQFVQLYREIYANSSEEINHFCEEIELDFIQTDLPHLMSSMKVGVQRIEQIVRSLRNFSRLDESEMKSIDLHSGIDSTLMIVNSRLKEHHHRPGIQVIKNYAELPLLECYAGQLNQVFMNLITNAIDAIEEAIKQGKWSQNSSQKSEKSLDPPTIIIETQLLSSQSVRVRIIDNGCGMSETTQQKIFDPFFTTKEVGKGTGLGLAITYKIIVEQHQGSLNYQSILSQGTEFIIEIPLTPPKKREVISPSQT